MSIIQVRRIRGQQKRILFEKKYDNQMRIKAVMGFNKDNKLNVYIKKYRLWYSEVLAIIRIIRKLGNIGGVGRYSCSL